MTGQTSQAFAEFAENGSIGGWLFGRRDGSASTTTPAKAHPTPPTALDSEPPQITSDILLSRAAIHSPAIQFAPPPPKDAGPKSTKYTNEADWRKAISEALKRRRASGANGQSHGRNKKRVQMGNVQSSLLSFPPPSGLSGQHQSRPLEPASTSSTSASASTSESSDVEMDHLTPILAPENIPDDSNDGDWEEGSQGSNVSVANLLNSQLQTEATEAADTVPHRALELTPSGRLYLRWNNEPMYGTLIPDGYEWSTARPGFPWICPVRSCRKLFPAVKQLGGHFVRQHRGSLLNDNMDGTLSIRGRYADLRNGEGVPLNNRPKPGIVVSVGPLDPSEPPMVAPSLPEQGRHDVDHNHSQLGAGSENSAAQSPALSLVKVSSKTHTGSSPPSNPEAFWKSLQPYLTNFKGLAPPKKGYVRDLLSLPKLRNFDWNYLRIQTNPFMDTNPRDISALILQVTGEPAPKPCHRCASGKGLFHSCVMISPQAPKDIVKNVIGCANCFYHFGQTYCSLKEWGKERAKKILFNGKPRQWQYWDPEWDAKSTTLDVSEQVDSSLTVGDAQPTSVLAASATGGPSSSTPSPGDGFEFAEPGRKYTEWSDENGDPRSLCGALIPAGYTMRSEPRQKPFCCPVRNCAMECMRVKDLGFHFARGHYASYLKDNGDGTFDVVGVYAPKRGNIVGSGKILNPSPPIVVAQTRPNGSIDWVPNWGSMKLLPTQDVAAAAAAAAVHDSASDVPMGEEAPVPNVSDSTPDAPQASRESPKKTWDWPPKSTWEQMEPTPILSQAAQNFWLKKVLPALPGASNIPRQPSVIKLLECRQKRELHPGPNAGENQFAGAKVREIAATVIQMVGDELQTGVCTKCQDERGMWRECVVVSQTANIETRVPWPACASCTFRDGVDQCSVRGKSVTGTAVANFTPGTPTGVKLRDWLSSSKNYTSTTIGTDGQRVVWKDKHQKHISPRPQAMMANEERDAIMEDVDQREEGPSTRYQMRTRATVSEQEQQQQQEPVIERRQPPNSLITKDGASNGVMATGLVPSESVFEMEDWEMAPGRIRDPSSESIAFSKSYLSSSQAVDVCEDIAFRVDTIQSGHNFKIEADSNQMRLCSLASGKLRVKIEDEPEFVIGPHGMFKVKAGVACTVTNRMYIDAIMHTTVLNGFVLG